MLATEYVKEAGAFLQEVGKDAAIERACFDYLSRQGYSNWANWEIQSEERRKIAAGWFAFHFQGVVDQMKARDLAKYMAVSRWKRLVGWWKEKVGRR